MGNTKIQEDRIDTTDIIDTIVPIVPIEHVCINSDSLEGTNLNNPHRFFLIDCLDPLVRPAAPTPDNQPN